MLKLKEFQGKQPIANSQKTSKQMNPVINASPLIFLGKVGLIEEVIPQLIAAWDVKFHTCPAYAGDSHKCYSQIDTDKTSRTDVDISVCICENKSVSICGNKSVSICGQKNNPDLSQPFEKVTPSDAQSTTT